ncbi:MAG: DUF1343 domain-containing protein [Treponema sp.]|nr:DUF1343 domain-containing protein [Treponema sp.]
MEVLNGIDRILKEDFGLKGKSLGLVTNHSGLTRELRSSIDIIHEKFNLKALYAPEHGVRGEIEAGDNIDTYTDKRTGLPVYSLYSSKGNTDQKNQRPASSMLAGIDMLLIDIQNIGCRFYTYESTMFNCMEECARAGITFIVLDRINPINGVDIDGNISSAKYRSFIGIGPVTNRHGMTMGELAQYYNKECDINCDLKVIEVKNWKRDYYSDKIGFQWVNPSPNIPGIDTALLYPGTCLFEGTTLSEGRGTTRPFEQIGAPHLDADELAAAMNGQNLPGVIFRPAHFLPSFSKHQGVSCHGVQLHIIDRSVYKPVLTAVKLLKEIITISGDKFAYREGNKPTDRRSIDLLAGTDLLRIEGPESYLELCKKDTVIFKEKRQQYLLY